MVHFGGLSEIGFWDLCGTPQPINVQFTSFMETMSHSELDLIIFHYFILCDILLCDKVCCVV